MKIVLITGGSGFVGSNIIKLLVSKKEIKKIYSLDNYSSGKKKNNINSNNLLETSILLIYRKNYIKNTNYLWRT